MIDNTKQNEKKIDDIIYINVENEVDRINYRGIFAMYIVMKDEQTRSLVDTVTKKWKKKTELMKILDDFQVPREMDEDTTVPNYYA